MSVSISRLVLVLFLMGGAIPVAAQPDVIVSNTTGIQLWGTQGGVSGYSLASTSCNIGDEVAIWLPNTNEHPLIAQDVYRIDGDGLLQHIGMSWLKHGFCAVNENTCGTCQATPCETLGIGCADTYSTNLNGQQGNLGPRSDVNASNGLYSYPFPTQGQGGNAPFKRLQVAANELDPALNPNSSYFGVVQYVTTDEPAFSTHFNNISYRAINVGNEINGGFLLSYSGSVVEQQDPIQAWLAAEADVLRRVVFTPEVEGGGQLVLGTRVVALGGGQFRYQYALFNNNSDRSAGSFSVTIPDTVTVSNIVFHDVDYHSGEPYSGVDWSVSLAGGAITWSTEDFATDPNANALRWGTTYTFGFDADGPPTTTAANVGLFKPGPGASVTLESRRPAGADVTPVESLSCSLDASGSPLLTWINPQLYDAIEILRAGVVVDVLPGTATSHVDESAPEGQQIYVVNAVFGGEEAGTIPCVVLVPPPPGPAFHFDAPDVAAGYDVDTGEGAFDVSLQITEDPDNAGFPHEVFGLAMGIAHDPELLAATTVVPGSDLAGMNGGGGPEFFSAIVYPDGITVGVVFAFDGSVALVADVARDAVQVSYETVPAALAGDADGLTTALAFSDELGDPLVLNSIVLAAAAEGTAILGTVTVTLAPGIGDVFFIRGDDNGDGSIGLIDPIYSLDYQFQGGPSVCLAAMDFDANGAIGLVDAIANLQYQFLDGPAPVPPFPDCGADPGPGSLSCDGPVTCP